MTAKEWLKPSECARRMGHADARIVIDAIKAGQIEARAREGRHGRVRYLVHVNEFTRWFNATWRSTRKAG